MAGSVGDGVRVSLHSWASLGGPLLDAFRCLASSQDLVACCLVCKGWRELLRHSAAPWAAALRQECGYEPQLAEEWQAARRLLIAARTSGVWFSGQAFAGLACGASGRFTAPERLLLVASPTAEAEDDSSGGSAPSSQLSAAAACLGTAAGVPRSRLSGGGSLSIRAVAAGADFAVLLTWDGRVLDTRSLAAATGASSAQPRRALQQGALDWAGLWRPPCCRAVGIAAGGCWQGSGRPGGHVLVVTDEHTVWAWGSNSSCQLGLGCSGSGSGPPTAASNGTGSWAAAPVAVVDAAAAASMGLPIAAACGDEHSALLCQSGQVFAAGSNAAGACGLPVVQLQAAVFSEAPLPAGQAAAVVSCGGRNMAVVTRGGHLLACGANDVGQAGVGRQAGSCYLLADIGPSAAWHGMQRSNQRSGGGGGEAAAAAAGVACGCGSMYALSDCGEAYSWGQGGQGELGLGGNSKNVCVPSRLPWAHDIACLVASCGGRFAAAVDTHGRLFSFGAGKSGALGHGDTAKRAVGRQVKALQGRTVHAVACGADWMLVVAGWRPPAGKAGRGSGGSGGSRAAAPAAAHKDDVAELPAGREGGESVLCGFRYAAVDPPPSPRSPRHRGRRRAEPPGSDSGSLPASSAPSTPRGEHRRGGDAGAASASSPGSRLRGRSGREARREEALLGRAGRRASGSHAGPELPDSAQEAVVARRQRWRQEPPLAASSFSPAGSDCDSGPEEEGGSGGGSPRQDHRMCYLLRRQLKAFSNDPRQRQLVFPRSFSARDRWKIHVMAEAWGLMHESTGEGPKRKLVVWKPSRSRKSLKPAMLAELAGSSSDSEDGAAGSAGLTAATGDGGPGSQPGPHLGM